MAFLHEEKDNNIIEDQRDGKAQKVDTQKQAHAMCEFVIVVQFRAGRLYRLWD